MRSPSSTRRSTKLRSTLALPVICAAAAALLSGCNNGDQPAQNGQPAQPGQNVQQPNNQQLGNNQSSETGPSQNGPQPSNGRPDQTPQVPQNQGGAPVQQDQIKQPAPAPAPVAPGPH